MPDYFDGCASLDDAKARYRLLMREFHPDNLTRLTQEVNDAYDTAKRKLAHTHTPPATLAKDERMSAYLYLLSLGMSGNSAIRVSGYSNTLRLTA